MGFGTTLRLGNVHVIENASPTKGALFETETSTTD
jgi:hypothetical protein